MVKVDKIESIYPAVDELIKILNTNDTKYISNILYHRMHKVSWSCRDELLEELHNVLLELMDEHDNKLKHSIIRQFKDIINIIEINIDINN